MYVYTSLTSGGEPEVACMKLIYIDKLSLISELLHGIINTNIMRFTFSTVCTWNGEVCGQ